MGRPRKPLTPNNPITEVKPAEISTRSKRWSDALRMEAGLVYVTDAHGMSVEDLRKDPRFSNIPLTRLRSWSEEDQWDERRRQTFDRFRKEIEKRIGSEMAKARMNEFHQLKRIQEIALTKLNDPAIPTRSWEGTAKTLLDINERMENLAVSVSRELIPGQHGGGVSPSMKTELSTEEIQAAAKEILRLRREQVRGSITLLPAATTSECNRVGAENTSGTVDEKGESQSVDEIAGK